MTHFTFAAEFPPALPHLLSAFHVLAGRGPAISVYRTAALSRNTVTAHRMIMDVMVCLKGDSEAIIRTIDFI